MPLAERLRPTSLEHYVGQRHLVAAPDGILYRFLTKKLPRSLVFWGPPGCGKTSLAKLYLKAFSLPVETISATTSATQDFKRIIDKVQSEPLLYKPTIVWIDEVHRLTRPQQDLLLQSLEEGALILVAATTENPSFQLAPALLSRLQVMTLEPLGVDSLCQMIERVEKEHAPFALTVGAKNMLSTWAAGDARTLLNWLDQLLQENEPSPMCEEAISKIFLKKKAAIDATGEGRYQMISALHKAVRGSDCQAALYWLARMLTAGEDARYIARRMIRMAVEDIGLADPQALGIALDGLKVYETLGSPEGELALAEVAIYLALAPKSNALYMAYKDAVRDAEKTSQYAPPPHIINPVTSWMQKQGFGAGYRYDHDEPDAFSGQNYFPDAVEPKEYYTPVQRGFERELEKRLAYFAKLRTR